MMTKTFDCVEMKRRGGEYVHALTAGMTLEQKIEYWRKRSEDYRKEWLEHQAKDKEQGKRAWDQKIVPPLKNVPGKT